MKESLVNELISALQIPSGAAPIESELDAMPDDKEITLTFCAEDLKEIRATLAKVQAIKTSIEYAKKLNAEY